MKKWILRFSIVAFLAGGIYLFAAMDKTDEYDFGISSLGRSVEVDKKANDGWGMPIFMR